MDRTAVEVVSEPGRELNAHRITLEGDFGRAYIEIESKPSPDNPRSSAIAAYAVLASSRIWIRPFHSARSGTMDSYRRLYRSVRQGIRMNVCLTPRGHSRISSY